jgi:hypothetical protein
MLTAFMFIGELSTIIVIIICAIAILIKNFY